MHAFSRDKEKNVDDDDGIVLVDCIRSTGAKRTTEEAESKKKKKPFKGKEKI